MIFKHPFEDEMQENLLRMDIRVVVGMSESVENRPRKAKPVNPFFVINMYKILTISPIADVHAISHYHTRFY